MTKIGVLYCDKTSVHAISINCDKGELLSSGLRTTCAYMTNGTQLLIALHINLSIRMMRIGRGWAYNRVWFVKLALWKQA